MMSALSHAARWCVRHREPLSLVLVCIACVASTIAGTLTGGSIIAHGEMQYYYRGPAPLRYLDPSRLSLLRMRFVSLDAQTIRLAVSRFAGGSDICCGEGSADLTSWSQLPLFVARVGDSVGDIGYIRVRGPGYPSESEVDDSGMTIVGVNPWGGDYVLVVDTTSPNQFELRITEVDLEEARMLVKRSLVPGALEEPTIVDDGRLAEVRVVYPLAKRFSSPSDIGTLGQER